ncbi:zinc binding enoyl reductase [Westerdykella ornata]|uniref:Zinc binding enoyl reductase n=1 Tax=Westerdykella ornata TaxID=318751 RepID=A0A6A6J610_WESOR|nr:zinc binding enoyl reductase [Westerdykella ornata]KAF2271627.1 zinc binding enoyl reductase [Westerdykella ornata]
MSQIQSIPKVQTAIRQGEGGVLTIQRSSPVPSIEPDQVLVKTVAVAINPCDHKMPTMFPSPGATDGSDFAGIVVAVGHEVTKDLCVGDRVCGAVHASNPINHLSGSFADYVAAYADYVLKVPDTMSWTEAAAFGGVVLGTLGLALFQSLQVPGHPENPSPTPFFALVYGGSTASGTAAIQLLKLSGARVITTCSPRNFDLVKSYGAEAAFDYNSPTCAEDIKAYTGNRLKYVLDTITEAKTIKLCYNSIGRTGGRLTGLENIPTELTDMMRKSVKADWVLGITLTGKRIALGSGYESAPSEDRRRFGGEWFKTLQNLLDAGKLRGHPPRVMDGGFEGILQGVDMLKRREVSGEKLVYVIG